MGTAYIFDFDGVLVNTMGAHFACYREALQEQGVGIDREQFYHQAGMTGREQIRYFADKAGIEVDVERVYRRKGELFERYLGEVRSIDCNMELFRTLRAAGYRCAIATGSSRKSLEPVMRRYALEADAVVTAEDVQRGKPNADLFLLAAGRLGAQVQECVVVEDSDVGIESAKRAGMRALRFFDLR